MQHDLEALYSFGIALQELAKALNKDEETIARKRRVLVEVTKELKEKCPYLFRFDEHP
jgi:hypothetical protein